MTKDAATQTLSSQQAQALFDLLTHHEAYAEIRALKDPESIAKFGSPFQADIKAEASSSPLLQLLLQRFVFVLPGLKDAPPNVWSQRISGLATALAESNLSESYDKGSIGIRKTLSTAIAAMIEYVARGVLGGYAKKAPQAEREYDANDPNDVVSAWDELLQGTIHGDMLDKLFAKAAETDQLSDHESVVRAAHEYIFIVMGSFLHYILVISPRGQSMLPLLIRLNDLLPYFLIRQTLRVGNAATMLSGMMRIVLAKMNMSSLTSWMGGTPSDSGMNLMQQIISTVLGWDTGVLRKRASKLEQDKSSSPSKGQLDALRAYCAKSAEEQAKTREESENEERSIVVAILEEAHVSTDFSERQHTAAMDYIAMKLAIRDRDQLIKVMCHHSPDLFTSSVRDLVTAYEPIIRALHKAYDLSGGVSDLQAFLADLIKLAKIDNKSTPPTVEDCCQLLKKHQGSSHRFLHQVLKNGKELSEWYYEYAKHALSQYRSTSGLGGIDSGSSSEGAGDFTAHLNDLMSSLSKEDQALVSPEIDKYAKYLQAANERSSASMRTIIQNLQRDISESSYGPGVYLSKWQSLMDEAPITPATAKGSVRSGKSASVRDATRIDTDGVKKGDSTKDEVIDASGSDAPDTSNAVRLLLPGFKEALAKRIEA